MTGQAAGGDSSKVWREAARMAASLNLLQIASVDLMHPQGSPCSTLHEPDLTD